MTIVGVAPHGFDGTTLGTRPDVYVPITMRGADDRRAGTGFDNRRSYWVYLFARLKPGVDDRAGDARDQRRSTRRSSTTSKRRCRRA